MRIPQILIHVVSIRKEAAVNKKTIMREYITGELSNGEDEVRLKDDDNLIEGGVLDSLGILKLISFIEERFNIQVANEDIKISNFSSINAILTYLQTQEEIAGN